MQIKLEIGICENYSQQGGFLWLFEEEVPKEEINRKHILRTEGEGLTAATGAKWKTIITNALSNFFLRSPAFCGGFFLVFYDQQC
jgi:hypothetical protein